MAKEDRYIVVAVRQKPDGTQTQICIGPWELSYEVCLVADQLREQYPNQPMYLRATPLMNVPLMTLDEAQVTMALLGD